MVTGKEVTGPQMVELFNIMRNFFDEVHSILMRLDEKLDNNKFKQINNRNNVMITNSLKENQSWVPSGIQMSYENGKKRIGINIILMKEEDIEDINVINEPIITYSYYVLKNENNSDEWDNWDIISTLKNKLKLNKKTPLLNFQTVEENEEETFIQKGFIKAKKLFDIRSNKDINKIANEINIWMNEIENKE